LSTQLNRLSEIAARDSKVKFTSFELAQKAKSAEEFELGSISGATQAFSPAKTQDSKGLLLDICHNVENLSEEPDAGNSHVRFCEGAGANGYIVDRLWPPSGKPGG
jgi:hypothetical protein